MAWYNVVYMSVNVFNYLLAHRRLCLFRFGSVKRLVVLIEDFFEFRVEYFFVDFRILF